MTTDNNDSPVTKKTPGKPSAEKLAEVRERQRKADRACREIYAQQMAEFYQAGLSEGDDLQEYRERVADDLLSYGDPIPLTSCEFFEGEPPGSHEDPE